jgi:hypothetical protein
MGAVSAHIAEHLAFQYRIEIEKQLGIELPSADVDLPPQVEAKLSSLVAQAAEQLLNMNQAEAQQQQQAAQAQDPVLQLKQRELALEEQEAASKAQVDQQRVQNQAAKIAQDQARAEMRQMLELLKIEAQKEQTQMKIDSNEKIAGAELGANIVGATNDRDERLERQRMLEKSKGAEIGRKIAETITNPRRNG